MDAGDDAETEARRIPFAGTFCSRRHRRSPATAVRHGG
jgi:hypothetical protein